jgi:hypothetical protein
MSKFVMVTTVSQFRMRYVIEVSDDECDFPTDFAKDTVVCEEALEFTQKHLGESIVDAQEIELEDAIAQYRQEEPVFSGWSDEQIIENVITKFAEDEEI